MASVEEIPEDNYVIDDYDEENIDIDEIIKNVSLNIQKKQKSQVDDNGVGLSNIGADDGDNLRPKIKKNKTICLNMIVKNESKVIERCLTSCLPLIDYWIISDTGSTDGTQEIIKNFFKKHEIPGRLYEDKWINFGENRSIALKHVRDSSTYYANSSDESDVGGDIGGDEGKEKFDIDYIIIIDADEVFKYDDDLVELEDLECDKYHILTRYGVQYDRVQLVANRFEWKYIGVLHEYISAPGAKTLKRIKGVYDHPSPDGARSGNPTKYQRDAALLELALYDEPDNERYYFYLAQSYRDYGNFDKAIEKYAHRASMGGFPEEVFYSLYQVGISKMRRGDDFLQFFGDLIKAYENRPTRYEPLFWILVHCNNLKMFNTAYNLCKPIWKNVDSKLAITQNKLFLEIDVYQYKFFTAFFDTCLKLNDFTTCFELSDKVLNANDVPEEIKKLTAIKRADLEIKVTKLYELKCFKPVDLKNSIDNKDVVLKDGKVNLSLKQLVSGGLLDDPRIVFNNIIQKTISLLQKDDKKLFYNITCSNNYLLNYGLFRAGVYIHITPENVNNAISCFNLFKITNFTEYDFLFFILDHELEDGEKAFFLNYKPKDYSFITVILNPNTTITDIFGCSADNNELYLTNYIFKMMTDVGCKYITTYNPNMIYHPEWLNLLIKSSLEMGEDKNFLMTTLMSKRNVDSEGNQTIIDRDDITKRQCLFKANNQNIDLLYDLTGGEDIKDPVEMYVGSFSTQLAYIIDYDEEEKDRNYVNDRFSFSYKGYRFYPGVDSEGGDSLCANFSQMNPLATVNINIIDKLVEKSNSVNALAFNTSGWIKHKIKRYNDWGDYGVRNMNGLFVNEKAVNSIGAPF